MWHGSGISDELRPEARKTVTVGEEYLAFLDELSENRARLKEMVW